METPEQGLQEEEFDFDAALAAKVAPPAEETTHAEEPAEEAGDSQPRDDQGRFAPKAENAETPADERLIAGKFKTYEELEAAYQELDSFRGRQGQELGELRQQLEELRSHLERPEEPQHYPLSNDLVERIDELAEERPAEAAVWALQNQPLLYERVMDTWYESDPKGASRFEQRLQLAQLRAELKGELEERIEPVAGPIQSQAQERQFAQAWASVAQRLPDLSQFGQAIMQAAEAAPELAVALRDGDATTQERMIENLYWLAKGRQADTLQAAAAEMGRNQATQVVEEKIQATVASGSSATARGEKSNIEIFKERMLAPEPTSLY